MIADKIALLMEETGCDRGEAELALELCGYDLESAVQAVPRLFQNILILKGRILVRSESLYGLWLVFLNLKDRSLMRARAVLSYNPAVYSSELDRHWFDFEARLYACRLWVGTIQSLSQEAEQILSSYFSSSSSAAFYEEGRSAGEEDLAPLRALLSSRFGEAELQARRDILDMGEFREVRPADEGGAEPAPRPSKRSARAASPGSGTGGLLVLRVALVPEAEGELAAELRAGDMVYAAIEDPRDIATYLARLFGARSEEGVSHPLLVPVEALERGQFGRARGAHGHRQGGADVLVRVRFAAGVCGDVVVPADMRLKVVRRSTHMPWWKKIFG